jgi:hypothetical protein
MPTKKRRLNITLKKDTAFYVKKLALRDDVPEATKASELIEAALEIEEDIFFSKIADERDKKTKNWISYEEFAAKVL